MKHQLKIYAIGHKNITANHRSTFEITKDKNMTKKADCIIALRASHALNEFSEEIKEVVKSSNTRIELILHVGDYFEVVGGRGHQNLTYSDKNSMVVRRSKFTCGRTLMIESNKAACDIDRRIIELLKEEMPMEIRINIYPEFFK